MIFVSKVFFETGDVGVAETFRVRAGNETVPASERVNTTITVNTDCGAVDGVSTRLVSRVTCHVSCVTCHVSCVIHIILLCVSFDIVCQLTLCVI